VTNKITAKLKGGDLRSIGRSNEVAEEAVKSPASFADLIRGLLDEDRLVRMRTADSVEKMTRKQPELLQRWKRLIVDTASRQSDKEMRWHMAQILPRLHLTSREREKAFDILIEYLDDKSSIVRTFSMQALCDFALQDDKLLEQVYPIIERLTTKGTAAMKSRGRKLLAQLETKRLQDR
jgi:HEAT repeat protein